MARTITTKLTGPLTLKPSDNPLTITASGSVTSTGAGQDAIDGGTNATWSVTNRGSINSSSGIGLSLLGSAGVGNYGSIGGKQGVSLRAGGTLTNFAGGSITASGAVGGGFSSGAGVYVTGASGTVTNNGTLTGAAYGVAMARGGTVTNTSKINGGEDGIIVQGGTGKVTNSGAILATVDDGMALDGGGTVTNQAGASISGQGGSGAGVFVTGGLATINNSGSITGANHHGVLIAAGGTLTNNGGGSISGNNTGVFSQNLSASVSNAGTISSTGADGAAVYLENSGSITNLSGGLINGSKFGAFIEQGGTVTNSGQITAATYDGVILGLGGTVTNNASGLISANSIGIYVKYRTPATVTNAGIVRGTGLQWHRGRPGRWGQPVERGRCHHRRDRVRCVHHRRLGDRGQQRQHHGGKV